MDRNSLPKIFLSHSSKDKKFVEDLATRLSSDGFSVWFDDWEIRIGDSIVDKINHGISTSDFLIVILSENSVNSNWVREELNAATIRNIESKGAFILPLLLNKCEIPPLLADKKYADFISDPEKSYKLLVDTIKYKTDQHRSGGEVHIRTQPVSRSFIDRVSELYKLLHYRIEQGKAFGGHQIDLFLTGIFGDLKIFRAIECKAGQVNLDDLNQFITKLRLVQREFPTVQGTIVSGGSFSEAVRASAAALGIQLTTYRDLAAQLLDGHAYSQALINEIGTNDRYPLSHYVHQFVGHEIDDDSVPAFEFVDDWLKDETWNQLTILGDLGTGKTFFTRMLAFRLANDFIQSPLENPLPIRIDLRKADREFSLEGLIITHLVKSGLPKVTFDVFQYSLTEGKIILILDGFDEMSSRVSPIVTRKNFSELVKCVKGRAKVLLTCRTHYFKSKTEEEEVLLDNMGKYESAAARDLYWELVSRKGFRIAYLRPFTISQIEEFVYRFLPDSSKEAMKKIHETYNLMELSQRPLLLDMVVKSLDRIKDRKINIATLYQIFTDAWIHREQWREVITPEIKLQFLTDLSFSLWQEESSSIHHTKLLSYLQKELEKTINNPQEFLELDHEIRTASFLTRDEAGYYGFAHKSFAEYFLARYLAQELNNGNTECLRIRRISIEVIGFLKNLLSFSKVESMLRAILQGEYTFQISENAFICYYSFMCDEIIESIDKGKKLNVKLPDHIQLNGAQLEQVVMENVEVRNINLNRARLSEAILTGANLAGAQLNDAVLNKTNLCSANLKGAKLIKANLESANLDSADLSEAKLNNANLSAAILLNVTIQGADLTGVNGQGALLSQSDVDRFTRETGSRTTVENVFQLGSISRIKDDSEFIKSILPDVQFAVKAAGFAKGIDSRDMIGELIIKIMNPQIVERLKKNPKDIKAYLMSAARSIADKMSTGETKGEERFWRFEKVISNDELLRLKDVLGYFDDPLNELITHQMWIDIESKLSKDLVRILRARYEEDLSIQEIAQKENVSPNLVHRKIQKALEILRTELSEYS